MKGPVRFQPHVAFRVDNLAEASKGLKVLLEPFDVGFATVAFYQTKDNAVVELMKYKNCDSKHLGQNDVCASKTGEE